MKEATKRLPVERFHLHEMSRIGKTIQIKVTWVLPRSGRKENGESVLVDT
jgi:hypothetical protein